ncbi:carboxylic acid reductase [Gordonia sp. w5E2]|uniref:Oxidoreductase n=1 Tax=Gordonia jacobaea TaxID=122202 RepID=A0ABR5ICW2_9ACTN|nr:MULTISPECIES: carboxylic acid reductase [Gordonia]KNA91438.1 oxidoreductase [Gordonia jacobaea]SKY56034.1 acyl-CoA dehydrogenase [Mycobacteroides abscessus subsp. abscessus]
MSTQLSTDPAAAVSAQSPDSDVAARLLEAMSVEGALRVLYEGYADRPALGFHDADRESRWSTVSFRELGSRVSVVASLLCDAAGVESGDRVATLGFTSADYTAVSLAILGPLHAVEVPLQSGAADSVFADILDETEAKVLAVSTNSLSRITALIEKGLRADLTHLVVFDVSEAALDAVESARAVAEPLGISVHLVQFDDEPSAAYDAQAAPQSSVEAQPDDLALLIYTSGSTGAPKGAMYTQDAVLRLIRQGFGLETDRATDEYAASEDHAWVTLNFLPMSHVMGRATLMRTLGNGGTAYFTARPDLSELLDDLAAVAPTELHFVPRIWEMLHQQYLSEIEGAETDSHADVLTAMRRSYFERAQLAVTGSAPISPEVVDFVESMLDAPLVEGYGSTEAGGVIRNGAVIRPPVLDYMLVDVPELGYRTTDTPHPRGELLVKTTDIFAGYYRRPELTAEMFDDEGFYRTGDVMAETGPDQLVYLDRRNNVLKLSQGEFVTVARVESALTSPPIRQIYVYGNSSRPYLLAVVVPTDDAVDAASDDGELHATLLRAVRDIGERNGLAPVEIPRDIIVERTAFSEANGLLTGIRKLARPRLKEAYGPALEDLYLHLAHARADRLRDARASAAGRPTLDVLIDIVSATLDLAENEVTAHSKFTDLGGDSLTAVTLGNTLRDIFDAQVSVGVLTSPSSDLAAIADYIDGREGDARPTADTVHADQRHLRADELTVDAFLDEATLVGASSVPAADETVCEVLLTGATGFLGRYLAVEWLRRVARVDGHVTCLVRASDDETARRRLDAVFDVGDGPLRADYLRLAPDHLTVLAGDKDSPNLGLDDQVWNRLAADVDLIVDPAALVNHLLSYRELFGPNVSGTAELIRLALTTTRKPYVYISTVGVADQVGSAELLEDTDIRELSATRVVHDGYANGYGNSKWAGEVLLADAHDRFGLPVSVFRCDMIVADDSDLGQLNLPDMFTRLLMSVMATGLAPRSFYRLDADGGRGAAHYDALPVDFLAAAISALAVGDGHVTYNAVNPHSDGIDLDTFVGWLTESGEEIALVDDYDHWYRLFSDALADLPEKQRRHSLIPLLHNYAQPVEPVDAGVVNAPLFAAAVRSGQVTTATAEYADIPHITSQVVANYARGLRTLGVI